MNVSKFAQVFGVVFVVVGILGFVPGITANNHLLGIFEVSTLHNVVHILTGIAALLFSGSAPRAFFTIFGIVYLIVTVLGFTTGGVIGLFTVNAADNVLHLVVGLVALAVGMKKSAPAMGQV